MVGEQSGDNPLTVIWVFMGRPWGVPGAVRSPSGDNLCGVCVHEQPADRPRTVLDRPGGVRAGLFMDSPSGVRPQSV